ncbi:Arc family DNA-binding protein [Acinetobacter baylyi]|uniref:Arc family DNA-binding protein n=1 Tax=Acinetobacter baylyi TaxID=202950 RepID=UPI000EA36DA9|nr:Arc family DNA-binding protein [Acinetobacter baylyi]
MSNQADHTIVRLRVPPELKEKIEKAAEENNRSQSAEMVDRLEKSFETSAKASLTLDFIKAARENHDLLRKQIKASNFIMMKLAEKLPDEDALKISVLKMLESE